MRFVLPSDLHEFSAGEEIVEIDSRAGTVRDALDALWRSHPALRDRILLETGAVRPHVNVFVGLDSVRHTGGLDTRVKPNDEITVLRSVSGG